MQWWKWIGLAGLAGVAATGAVVARDERKRQTYSPEEVRTRLHERASGVTTPAGSDDGAASGQTEPA